MGNRLTKIYTRTGDDGTTGLGDGSRVEKDDPRVEAYGTVDELNSAIGIVLSDPAIPATTGDILVEIQHTLFNLGGELCMPGHVMVESAHVLALEGWLDEINEELPPLQDFVLPAGGRAAAACHLARAICRRAERRVWTLSKSQDVNDQGMKYLNRLSDLLFVIARSLARNEPDGETLWKGGRLSRPDS